MKVRTNKYIIGMLFCGALLTATSCSDDFLQKDSLTSVSKNTFWKTAADAKEGLAACYDALQNGFCIMMPQTRTNGTVVVPSTWMP